MSAAAMARWPARLVAKVREVGLTEALRLAGRRLIVDERATLPLARVERHGLFATDTEAIHEAERTVIRSTAFVMEASQVEASYPHAVELGGRFLRYAYLPAREGSRGLVVLFHGHNAFLHMGPVAPWRRFDVLAPWDTFGWKRQGSWFWGERGDDFVARMVQMLIARHRTGPGRPWFCTGASMGGFGALWHGIKYGCDGLYVVCPQIDLKAKIADHQGDDGNPYAHLEGPAPGMLPDLYHLAEACDRLPPLYLIQNQYDHVNPFAAHALRLVEVYNRRRAWCGLRVHPSIGHGGDGSQAEAEMFFELILDRDARRGPPVVPGRR